MADAAEPTGSLQTALAHAARLLPVRPDLAAEQAREIVRAAPAVGDGHLYLGLALARLGDGEGATAALTEATRLAPGAPHAWRALGDQLGRMGDAAGADGAYARQIRAATKDPALMAAAADLCDGKLARAEQALRRHLKAHPTDVAAIRMLAEVGARLGRFDDAETLLTRCLELAPSFIAARHNLATVLHKQAKGPEALDQLAVLLKDDPRNPSYRNLRAAALVRIGEYGEAIGVYEGVLGDFPAQPKVWMSFGHALKTVGRQAEAIAAYRRSIAQLASLGEAYWSLANLKTFRFTPAEVEAMRRQLERADLEEEDRFHLHFALGKALEDAGDFAASFEHYAAGNAQRRVGLDYKADETTEHVTRSRAFFTPAFFAERAGWGRPAPDPIFVVGLPRAGSTLVEQILSSHSAIEGTMELPDIAAMARRLGGGKRRAMASAYPEALDDLTAADAEALGEEFLERTAVQRKLGRPLFIDKMPNNFAHVGFIKLILPNAKIVDARRHPLGCCFSGFKQHFARGQGFTYDLTDIGRYYADYVALMDHFDAVLPGAVHRVFYEAMVTDPERQVRALLDYCGVPFEDACLRFYETERAVRTASSEQVRQPIYSEGVDQWRAYEPWLGPLKEALGVVLDAYPA